MKKILFCTSLFLLSSIIFTADAQQSVISDGGGGVDNGYCVDIVGPNGQSTPTCVPPENMTPNCTR